MLHVHAHVATSPQMCCAASHHDQVAYCYKDSTSSFAEELMELLDRQGAVLDPDLRLSLVKSLILLRHRGQVAATQTLPLLFKLFRCSDKLLRQTCFRHIVAGKWGGVVDTGTYRNMQEHTHQHMSTCNASIVSPSTTHEHSHNAQQKTHTSHNITRTSHNITRTSHNITRTSHTDIKNSNKKHVNEALNRQLQSFLYTILAGDNTRTAKKSLAVLCELYRRGVWRDAKTVNVIGRGEGGGGGGGGGGGVRCVCVRLSGHVCEAVCACCVCAFEHVQLSVHTSIMHTWWYTWWYMVVYRACKHDAHSPHDILWLHIYPPHPPHTQRHTHTHTNKHPIHPLTATALLHKDVAVMLPAVKFFLGQDEAQDDGACWGNVYYNALQSPCSCTTMCLFFSHHALVHILLHTCSCT